MRKERISKLWVLSPFKLLNQFSRSFNLRFYSAQRMVVILELYAVVGLWIVSQHFLCVEVSSTARVLIKRLTVGISLSERLVFSTIPEICSLLSQGTIVWFGRLRMILVFVIFSLKSGLFMLIFLILSSFRSISSVSQIVSAVFSPQCLFSKLCINVFVLFIFLIVYIDTISLSILFLDIIRNWRSKFLSSILHIEKFSRCLSRIPWNIWILSIVRNLSQNIACTLRR